MVVMGKETPSLRPVELPIQPVGFQDRYKVIHKICEALEKVAYPRVKLAKFAVSLELKLAKESKTSQLYRFNVGILLRDIVKFKANVYKLKIANKPLVPQKVNGRSHTAPITTKQEVFTRLRELLIDKETLRKNGYILPDVKYEPQQPVSSHVTCVRCGTKFSKEDIMNSVVCKFHPSKKLYDKSTKLEIYPCCGESTSSVSFLRLGCSTQKHHVYKGETYSELCTIANFLTTDLIDGKENVLALDCEMGFTTMGYEMVRLTIVDFFTSKTLYDEIIRPIGEVIDLNTQFSGVREEDILYAKDYEDVMEDVLRADMINRNSILIGHGLENDLNVMRLFHTRILDTAIMYSVGRFKNSLKNLSFEILSRKIQLGEHDSSQDAIAAMDIIKAKNGISITQTDW